MRKFIPAEIFVEEKVKDSDLARSVLEKFPLSRVYPINSVKDYLKNSLPVSITRAKNRLFIASQKGRFVKPCPGTPGYLCCNYFILDIGCGCFYDCSYCYLQTYINFPGIILYANLDDFLQALDKFIKKNPSLFYRLGTGEFIDSLALEDVYSYAKKLIPFFSNKNIMLELKTKSDNVEELLNLNHGEQTVISWSVNPPLIIKNEEKRAVSLKRRLRAAQLCSKAGYPVGFHFDPIIAYSGWEEDYRRVVKRIFQCVPKGSIRWISLGTLRFPPPLKKIIAKRFPESEIIFEEFITGLDGKLRYFKPKRIKIYQKIASWIKEIAPNIPLYLCMEGQSVWQKVFGFIPMNPKEVEKLFLKYQGPEANNQIRKC